MSTACSAGNYDQARPVVSWVQGRDRTASARSLFYCFQSLERPPGQHILLSPAFWVKRGRLFSFTLATPDGDFCPHEDLSLTGVQIQQSGKRLSQPLAWDLERSGDLLPLQAAAPLPGSQEVHR